MKKIRIIDRIVIIIIIVLIIPLLFNQIGKINDQKLKSTVDDIVDVIKEDIKDLDNNEIMEYKIDNSILEHRVRGKGIAFVDVDDSITVILENNEKCAIKYPFSDQVYIEDNTCGVYKLIKGAKMQIVSSGDGLYEILGSIYRYKGLNPNNYLQYNNQLWRIMEIGSKIKIITVNALDSEDGKVIYEPIYRSPSINEVISATLNGCKIGEFINCEETYLSDKETELNDTYQKSWYLYTDGNIYPDKLGIIHDIRMVQSLNESFKIIGGNGTSDSPYIVNETILSE